ncbi:MAG: hypothetical protein KH366_09395 [Clostridiaceae bacterium]|nr:hypothetical protein [Clostridiaceae bacterium]
MRQLSIKPLLIDVLIIKVKKGGRIHKNIGKIFREYNIIEYKSPEDYLNINDYYKVLGYACLYQADTEKVCQISPEEITITFVCTHFPQKLMKYLTDGKELDVLMRANHDTIEEAKYMCDAIRELFADELREGIAKGVAEGLERGKAWGLECGLERGIAITKMVLRMDAQGKSVDEIAKACEITEEKVRKILTE